MVPEGVKRHVSVDIILRDLRRHEPTRTYVCRDHPACLPSKVCAVSASMLGRRMLYAWEGLQWHLFAGYVSRRRYPAVHKISRPEIPNVCVSQEIRGGAL